MLSLLWVTACPRVGSAAEPPRPRLRKTVLRTGLLYRSAHTWKVLASMQVRFEGHWLAVVQRMRHCLPLEVSAHVGVPGPEYPVVQSAGAVHVLTQKPSSPPARFMLAQL